MNLAIIGAGPMGLAVAHELQKTGHHVTIFERDDRIGGMTASIPFAGVRIERYYHFVCGPDQVTFEYLREFDRAGALKWVETKMGFFFQGKLFDWGHPLALLKFPGLTLLEKVRYALHVMYAKSIQNWTKLDKVSSTVWLKRWVGDRAYNVMWKSLFHYKFYELQDSLSAAWLGTRIRRVALSRKSIFKERLGYIEGGSETLLNAMAEKIRTSGGSIRLNTTAERIVCAGLKASGVSIAGVTEPFDAVVSTVPLPYVAKLVPDLPAAERDALLAIKNVAVVCVLLHLREPFTHNFWLNINDTRIEIPGLIEYSNLNPLGASIIYAPFYMPHTHEKYRDSNETFIEETIRAMSRIKPGFSRHHVIDAKTSRYEYAQTVCTPNFFAALPPIQSAIAGLYVADTSHYYPEDRSIHESFKLGRLIAAMVAQYGNDETTRT
jgi:protoporphyrinogen oxidase